MRGRIDIYWQARTVEIHYNNNLASFSLTNLRNRTTASYASTFGLVSDVARQLGINFETSDLLWKEAVRFHESVKYTDYSGVQSSHSFYIEPAVLKPKRSSR